MILLTMIISSETAEKVKKIPVNEVFTYRELLKKTIEKEAVIKALNRMTRSGLVVKISKGRYYRPEITDLGIITPGQNEIVKDLLYCGEVPVGYLTTYSIYNRLGLTSQVSSIIQIGKNDVRPAFRRGHYRITFLRQKNMITSENIKLLRLLDVIKTIKRIPDCTIDFACRRLLVLIGDLSIKEIDNLLTMAMKYPPSARAVLGAILEELCYKKNLAKLRKSLNPISKYILPGAKDALAFSRLWNIE